jgi:hypothetical protein
MVGSDDTVRLVVERSIELLRFGEMLDEKLIRGEVRFNGLNFGR